MIRIFCGDDLAKSRAFYLQEKLSQQSTGAQIITLEPENVLELLGAQDAQSLFANKVCYCTQDLVPFIKKTHRGKLKEILQHFENADFALLNWESKSSYDLGLPKPTPKYVNEYKAPESSFSLIGAFYPGMPQPFFSILQSLTTHQPIEVTYAMLIRHVRLMLCLASQKKVVDSPYLVNLARANLSKWQHQKLLPLYRSLLVADVKTKTGALPFLSLAEKLQTIAHFML